MVNGGCGLRLSGFASTAATVKVGRFERLFERFRLGARPDVEPLEFLSVGAHEARFEGLVPRRRQRGNDRPVFARHEVLDLQLAVANEPQRHRLDAAGRARARQLAPQDRREREADQVVERAAREIGVDQRAGRCGADRASPRSPPAW